MVDSSIIFSRIVQSASPLPALLLMRDIASEMLSLLERGGPLWGHAAHLLSELGVERLPAAAGIDGQGRKIDLVECQKYLATYAYLGREREEFTRITRVSNARLGLNGPCLRDVYLGSSFFY